MQITEKKVSVLSGGLCAVDGVETNGIHTGFKAADKDLALIYFPDGATVTGVFTRNKIKAHGVIYDMEMLKNFTNFKAILVNSGNANACNGLTGERDVHTMTDALAAKLNIDAHEVLASSTGVIGEPMNLQPFYSGLDSLIAGLSGHGSTAAAEAIMTTDTIPKELSFEAEIGGQLITVTLDHLERFTGFVKKYFADETLSLTIYMDALGKKVVSGPMGEKVANLICSFLVGH